MITYKYGNIKIYKKPITPILIMIIILKKFGKCVDSEIK
jgi:hypothetical protein